MDSHSDWEMFIVSDASEDDMGLMARNAATRGIQVLETSERQFKAKNFFSLLPYMRGEVVLELDADDWLLDSMAFRTLNDIYDDPEVGATVGPCDYIPAHGERMGIEAGVITKAPRSWRLSLARQFIRDYGLSYLKDPATSEFYPYSGDIAISYPAMMLAKKIVMTPPGIYQINPDDGPDHDCPRHDKEQHDTWVTIAQRLQVLERRIAR